MDFFYHMTFNLIIHLHNTFINSIRIFIYSNSYWTIYSADFAHI